MKSVWFKLSQFLILPFLGSLCHRSVGLICLSFVHLFLACILVLGESDTSLCSIFRLCCLSRTSARFYTIVAYICFYYPRHTNS